jgi:S-adenosyl-L-methionine hydrolase (adenosine-forming)
MIITLTTDFGTADSYVAQMKGVILGIARDARIVDITHEVPPQDIVGGAFVLSQAVGAFPRGTVHVAVVDPGVGGPRDPIIIETDECLLVGPNNGVLSLAAPVYRAAYKIENPVFRRGEVSATFEGRDVFAPAAAQLAIGAPANEAGRLVDEVASVEWHEPLGDVGEVVAIDRFGNLITNLRAEHAAGARGVKLGDLDAPIVRTFGEVDRGYPLAYLGSSGFIELGVREGSAAALTGARRGSAVKVRR